VTEELPDVNEVPLDSEANVNAAVAMTLQIVVQLMSELEKRICAIEDKVGIERVDMPEVAV
jgi:hypothetical protein